MVEELEAERLRGTPAMPESGASMSAVGVVGRSLPRHPLTNRESRTARERQLAPRRRFIATPTAILTLKLCPVIPLVETAIGAEAPVGGHLALAGGAVRWQFAAAPRTVGPVGFSLLGAEGAVGGGQLL